MKPVDEPAKASSPAALSSSESPRAGLLEVVRMAILDVAPDLTAEDLASEAELHGDLGLDSIDQVNVARAIATRTGVEIPEADYASLRRIGDLVDFLDARRAHGG